MGVRRTFNKAKASWQSKSLTLFAKVIVLLSAELIFNAITWIIAVIVFTHGSSSQHKILPLALVAWSTGLRHGLDADHIATIDNATRRIVSVPLEGPDGQSLIRRPVTVGLFFSLGHSTIVVATITAIAISARIANGLNGFGNVGSIVGPAISGSFLILIGSINSYILYQTWTRIKGKASSQSADSKFNGVMTRIAMPLLRTVDRPWKLYPIGILFGLGFDTASSIALLSVAVVAQQGNGKTDGSGNASVVLLAFLFTAGMTLVDSIDSCLMIWAYAPELTRKRKIEVGMWERREGLELQDAREDSEHHMKSRLDDANHKIISQFPALESGEDIKAVEPIDENVSSQPEMTKFYQIEDATALVEETSASPKQLSRKLDESASKLSFILTFLSIIIGFTIGSIELLGLIGDQCTRCSRAADQQESSGKGGLEGRWWLTWRRANDNFGYIGAAIVGLFATSVSAYFVVRWLLARRRRSKQGKELRRLNAA